MDAPKKIELLAGTIVLTFIFFMYSFIWTGTFSDCIIEGEKDLMFKRGAWEIHACPYPPLPLFGMEYGGNGQFKEEYSDIGA